MWWGCGGDVVGMWWVVVGMWWDAVESDGCVGDVVG